MKKIWTRLAAVVLLLLIIIFGFLQYRKYQSSKNRIHNQAALILKIDLDGILESNALNFWRNPPKVLTWDKEEATLPKGFSIPSRLFIYNVHSKAPGTFFCSLQLSDTVALKLYLKKALKIHAFENITGGQVFGTSEDGKLAVAYNEQEMTLSYSLKAEQTKSILLDVLNKKNLLDERDQRLVSLLKIKAHLAYIFDAFSGSGKVKDNAISLEGSVPLGGLDVSGQPYVSTALDTDSDALVKIWLNAKPGDFHLDKLWTIGGIELSADSLKKYYKGYADLVLHKSIKQTDTLITYAYNDDFEKTEQKELKEIRVPDMRMTFSAKTDGLLNYLKKQKAIEGERLNKSLFPLYQVFDKSNDQIVQLSTNKDSKLKEGIRNTPYFFSAEANINQLHKDNVFPLLNSYLEFFTHLTVKMKREDTKKAHLEMEMSLSRN
ncbi:hypothetical protein DBR11_03275 [Pedobacter sp. HMWF019]|uniref:hypothetical protein n=1 Tax=Pedobacter sp. HMWF019 TaxID=2056856 RepID=UPI000D3986FB|nr:hypothetical protein [Pedobacter sp. HMWF019]PTT03115.1 hypothetical protein DBR11_03275 [Pedobacter sp. HMWF019]